MNRSIFRLGLFSNIWVWVGAGIMVLLQVLFTRLPVMNSLFHSAPIGVDSWITAVVIGLIIFIIVEIEKFMVAKIAVRRKSEKA
jgi:Ca2+-transporting ATPase